MCRGTTIVNIEHADWGNNWGSDKYHGKHQKTTNKWDIQTGRRYKLRFELFTNCFSTETPFQNPDFEISRRKTVSASRTEMQSDIFSPEWRVRYSCRLLRSGINVKLAGFGWQHKHKYRQTSNQHAWNNQVHCVEERLPFNDQVKTNAVNSILIRIIVMFSR